MSQTDSPAPKPPVWKRVLAIASITIGVVMLLASIPAIADGDIRTVIGALIAGGGLLLPGAMWMWWERHDKAAFEEAARQRELIQHLTDADRDSLGYAADPEPKLARRRLGLVIIAAAVLFVIGATVLPPPEEEWPNEQVRNLAFHEYACKRMETDDPSLVAGAVASTIPSMKDFDAGDRAAGLSLALIVTRGGPIPSCDVTSADYDYTFAEAWQRHLEEIEGADFTPAVAREHGVDFFD